jgi:cytochrome P450 family 9
MKDAFTRYTNDVIASATFGLKVNSLEDPENEFYKTGKNATTFNGWILVKFFFFVALPSVARVVYSITV